MRILLPGISAFMVSFVVHLIVWRIKVPNKQVRVLFGIFFFVPAMILIVYWIGLFFGLFEVKTAITFGEYLQIFILCVSLTQAYIATYPALQADSPSLLIILKIAEARSDGLDPESLNQKVNDDVLIIPRIRDLADEHVIYLDGDTYKLTKKGYIVAGLFDFYRKLLGESQKGG